ncbi:MAG: M48 family metalloprotease [Bacteroidetes bacterium]|nr:M48 family metalloprotease [Bacteroidota bacterium]
MLPEALPYHLKVRDHFRQQVSTWEFFAAARTREEQLAAFKTELLKNTYQFGPDTDKALYEKVDFAREKLGLGALPVTVYQAQFANDPELNASIVYLHQEAHIVLSGPIVERLNDAELLAVIAHELSHVRLFRVFDGELEVADRIITAIANNYNSEPPYFETARLFKLYTEIYCDRGAYAVVGDTGPVITSLLKIATGLREVSADSYAQQAEAVFSAAPGTQSATPTHPENFIRTRALRLWADASATDASRAIRQMIEGSPELDRLDLFAQRELNDMTQTFIREYLRPSWFRTTLVEGLAKEYYPKMAFGAPEAAEPDLSDRIAASHPSIRDYFAYVILDFVLADPSLEEMPAGRAFEFAAEMQLTSAFEPVYKKELRLSDKKWQQHKQKVHEVYASGAKD